MQKVKKALPKRQRMQISSVPKKQEAVAVPVAAPIVENMLPALASLWLGSQAAKNVNFNPALIGTWMYNKAREIYRDLSGNPVKVPTNRETVTASDNTRVARPMIFPESVVNRSKAQARAEAEPKDSSNVTPRDSSRVTPTNNGQAGSGGDNPKKDNKFRQRLKKLTSFKPVNVIKNNPVKTGFFGVGALDAARLVNENQYTGDKTWKDLGLVQGSQKVLDLFLSDEAREIKNQRNSLDSLKKNRERAQRNIEFQQAVSNTNNTPQQNTQQEDFKKALESILDDADSLTKK